VCCFLGGGAWDVGGGCGVDTGVWVFGIGLVVQ
jgi:hypothetical protein